MPSESMRLLLPFCSLSHPWSVAESCLGYMLPGLVYIVLVRQARNRYLGQADVWSLGCVILAMLSLTSTLGTQAVARSPAVPSVCGRRRRRRRHLT